MTCCKHLSHIRSPWPNGLPGLPEVAQHCLFADTVLPCRTCRRLKTTSKVRQGNEPVCSRVCNPRSTRSATPTVCWKCWRNRIIVFLWEPNALLTLETSPQASIVNAWICWFWFSLGMFSEKQWGIKCVFPYVVCIRIMSIHISCAMYLRLGVHMQIRLYYVLPYKVKISAQHRIGFILDRCIVYLGLTMPNLQMKHLLIFEIFDIKKWILFFGTEYIFFVHFNMSHRKHFNSNKTHVPWFDKILVI